MSFSTASAAPLSLLEHFDDPEAEGASMWVLLVASAVLVLLGGAFAGLTIAYVLSPLPPFLQIQYSGVFLSNC